MIFKHKNSIATKLKIGNFSASNTFYVSGAVDYIGDAERISIVGFNNKDNRRVFIRDITKKDFKFENKVILSSEEDINVFISIKSKNEVWVNISTLNIKEESKARFSLVTFPPTQDVREEKSTVLSTQEKIDKTNKSLLFSHTVEPFSVNKSIITLSFPDVKSLLVEGYDQENNLLLRRKVESGTSYPTIFRTLKNSSRIDYYINNGVSAKVVDNQVQHLEKIYEQSSNRLTETSVTAAMATYPARAHIYLDTVDSIIDQVDILYIYFNGYEDVPREILEHDKKQKIEYIVSPKSTLRASGKFSWIGTIPGYHITIDDDIIYPSDYVSRLISSMNNDGEQHSILGVHGSIFKRNVKDASKCREKIFNFQDELLEPTRVHMLGSGTTLFSPSAAKLIDVKELLSHPLANDELLAIQARRMGISMLCVRRGNNWLVSNPAMEFGVYEEKQLNKNIKSEVNNIVAKHNPWPPL